MPAQLNSVKSNARPYHHGDLQSALVLAAEQILTEKGVAGFSLREAARRAGVSPAAPAHHFKDASGLLTAVAAKGFSRMAEHLARAGDAAQTSCRLQALGAAYIDFAKQSPAIFSIMWNRELLKTDDAAYLEAGRIAFNVLERAATGKAVPVRTAPHVPDPSIIAAWSMIHGYARLILDGALQNLPDSIEDEVLRLLPTKA
ncbi:TetR/AcrR family transcriptional regulator [Sphingomonas sp. GCM10030256]|uniref:TetR/AcrR family transcriptional regulator n=1 Tax=Sphingomonas sp. GCM10030256 TaxID=3273427 RepID=UPI00361A379C